MPIPISRQEYEKIYGSLPPDQNSQLDTRPAPIPITRAEYNAKYKTPTQSNDDMGMYRRVTSDMAPDVAETIQGVINAGKSGRDKFTEAFSTPGLNPIQRIVGASIAPFQGAIQGLGEVAVGTAKLFTTDDFEKNLSAKIGDKAVEVMESELGQDVKSWYNALPDQSKYTVTNIIGPAAEVFGEVGTFGAAKLGANKVFRTASDALKDVNLAPSTDKSVQKLADEIFSIENNYVKLRKANEFSKDEGAEARTLIAQADVLRAGDVDTDGLIRTTQPGGAADRFYNQTLKGVEDVVRKNLNNEGRFINVNELESILKREIGSTNGLEGADLIAALNGLKREIDGLKQRANSLDNIALEYIHDAKIAATKHINFNTPPEQQTYRKALASTYKKVVEDKSSTNVREVNAELAKYYAALDKIKALDGRKVKGGRLGKYTAAISGNLLGMAGGSALGPAGAFVGGIAGGEVAAGLAGRAMANTFGRGTGAKLPENDILKAAKESAEAGKKVDLKTPDIVVGVPQGIPKTKEIVAIEKKIKNNVKQQKKAIKAKDYTLVAKLKEVYVLLVEALKDQIKFIKENIKSESGHLDIKGKGNPQSNSLGKRNAQYKTANTSSKKPISSKVSKNEKKGSVDKKDGTLAAVHNLTADKIAFSDEVGGLANPSVAVINPKLNDFENFGDISLIADSDFLFSGRGKTYGADVYSPRFPEVVTRAKDYSQFEKTMKKYVGDKFMDDESFYRVAKHNPAFEEAFEKNLKLPPRERIEEFGLFIESIAEEATIEKKLFDLQHFRKTGNRRYKEVTAENASKMMKKVENRSGETSFYGLPSIRSMVAPEFRSIPAIKKAGEQRIISKESFDQVKQSYEEKLSSLLKELPEYYKYQSNIGMIDDIGRGLGEYYGGDKSVLDEMFDDLPDEVRKHIDDFGFELEGMPTEYFETKFNRVVDLDEFSHALIPKDTPKSVRETLAKKGVMMTEYEKGVGKQGEALRKVLLEKGLLFGLGGIVYVGSNQ